MTSNTYCFTFFKFPELITDYCNKLSEISGFRYLIAQLENTPTTNRKHIQGYIEFKFKTAMSKIKQIMVGCHIERRQGTREEARDYCKKLESSIPNTQIELGKFELEQGRRTDIQIIKDCIKSGKSLTKTILEDCRNYQGIRIAEKLYYYSLKPRDPNKPPEIRWYYGKTGTGKTLSVYKEYTQKEIYPSFSYKWWNGYYQQKVLLIDDMRKDYAKFHILLKLLDRYPHTVEIKGGTTEINSPIIIITTPYHPLDMYETREDIQQLIRRITIIKKYSDVSTV